ncbi:MAG: hypothetical protein ABW321_01415 [Polyangiales bacterium]
MELPVLRMSFADHAALARELDENLKRGRAFVSEPSSIPVLSECRLVLVHPEDGRELALSAQVVMVSTTGAMCGVGLALTRLADELAHLVAFAASAAKSGDDVLTTPPAAAAEPTTARMSEAARVHIEREAEQLDTASTITATAPLSPSEVEAHYDHALTLEAAAEHTLTAADDDSIPPSEEALLGTSARPSRISRPLSGDLQQQESHQERLRHLNAAQQLKVARTGELADRIAVERLYGKQVWEALLHNPRLSVPEVARIARKGTVPKPLLELILENGAWIKADAVRRALLGNPKLGADAVLKLLRATPKHELKLIEKGTAYAQAVRESARKLLKQL